MRIYPIEDDFLDKALKSAYREALIGAVDYIDEIEVRSNPSRRSLEIVMVRKVREMKDRLTGFQRLPAWLQFAKARQGGD